MRPKHRALLFDLDGVLWDSVNAHREAFIKAFREMNLPWTLPAGVFKHVSGMTTENAIRHILKERNVHWTKRQLDTFSQIKRVWALRTLPTKAKIHPQLIRTLQRLQPHYRLGLVSAGHPRTIALFLKRSKTQRYFDAVLTSRDVRYSKPHPQIYRAALRKLKVRPEDALAVEDAVSGVQSASGAGIRVWGLKGTVAPAALRKAGAVKIISKLSELIDYAFDS